jgi:DNA adenine methylase
MKPILKWVGSKRWISNRIVSIAQPYLKKTYIEPFAGGASVFFDLQPKSAILSDTIYPLILTYQYLQTNCMDIKDYLVAMQQSADDKAMYESARSRFNNLVSNAQWSPEVAALFIYLNRAGFNGLWRQNLDGEYNVPFGNNKNIHLPSFAHLIQASRTLQKAIIHHLHEPLSVLNIISNAHSGDVIFADPPYYKTFNGYDGIDLNPSEFQQLLAVELWRASLRGVKVIAMNNSTKETRDWYSSFCTIEEIERKQNMAGDVKDRKQWNQILAISK